MITRQNRLYLLLGFPALLLLIPLIAMQFSTEVNWSTSDFVIGGILLFGTALLIEMVLRIFPSTLHRVIAAAMILFLLLIVWAELAVGVFGTPFAGS